MEKNKFLLPPGFRDLLPDAAEQEYFCTKILIDNFYKTRLPPGRPAAAGI